MKQLIKHEWLHVSKRAVFALLYLFAITLLAVIAERLNEHANGLLSSVTTLILFAYGLTMTFIAIVVYLYIGQRFQKNLYGNEGYLMQTLPVRKSSLVFAKGFVSTIWSILLAAAASVSTIIFTVVTSAEEILETPDEQISFSQINGAFQKEYGLPLVLFIALGVILLIMLHIFLINMMYAAISIGQLWRRHRTAGTLLAYLLFVILSVVLHLFLSGYVLSPLAVLSAQASAARYALYVLIYLILSHLILAAAFFAISAALMKYRLNLD